MRLVFLISILSLIPSTQQTPGFSTQDEKLSDTCPIQRGVGKGCCPPSQADLDKAEQQSISPTAPLPPLLCVLGVCGGSLFRNSLGHFPTEPGEILSVLLDKQVVVLSRRGLSVLASLSLPQQGCVGGLLTSTSKCGSS